MKIDLMRIVAISLIVLGALCGTSSAAACTLADYSWVGIAVSAFTIGACLIGLAYMFGNAFGLAELKAWANEEFFQLIMTAVLLALITTGLVSLDTFMGVGANNLSSMVQLGASVGTPSAGTCGLPGLAQDLTSQNLADMTNGIFASAKNLAMEIGKQSSQSGYCSFLGVGYSLTSCSALNAGRGQAANALNASAAAIADYSAQNFLLGIGANLALGLLFPLGIFLRCFHVTRPAGGVILAIALAFYLVLPLAVIFGKSMFDQAYSDMVAKFPAWNPAAVPSVDCNAFGMSEPQVTAPVAGLLNPNFFEPILFKTIIGALFLTTVNIFATLTAIRALAGFFGAEIDVGSLAKIS